MEKKGVKAEITLVIDEDGRIIKATENGEPLIYAKGAECKECQAEEGKTMDDGRTFLKSNPCCWRRLPGGWMCIPCNWWPC